MRRAEARKRKVTSVVVLIGGLLLIGGIGFAFAPRASTDVSPAPSAAPAATTPEPAPTKRAIDGIETPEAVAPLDLLGRAKAQASTWQPESILVSIEARPVVDGKVDLTRGGKITFVYGALTGEGFGGGARVKPAGFRVSVSSAGVQGEPAPTRRTRASSEPNCSLDEAVAKLAASGVSASGALDLSFAFSTKHDRAVWQVTVPGETAPRFVDGWSCNILVR